MVSTGPSGLTSILAEADAHNATRPTITAPHTLHANLPYTTTNHHPRQILDLYIPTPSSSTITSNSNSAISPSPLILYIHGGAFRHGEKTTSLLPHRQLTHSYAIAALNYRRSGEALFPAMIEDCKSALRFLKSPDIAGKYGLDASKVVVWGESAGGHAAAFLGTTSQPAPQGSYDSGDNLDVSSGVIGVVDYYGPTNFLQMDAHLSEGWQTHNDANSPESLYLGGQITRPEMAGKVREADPCTYVREMVGRFAGREACPRFFVAHGTGDRIVPEFMSELLVEKLGEEGVEVEYLPVEGADHVFRGITEEQQKVLDERTDAFLEKVFGR